MPELPEVETIRRGLQKHIVGRKIVGFSLLFPKIVRGEMNVVSGSTIRAVRRFGKGLIIDLNNAYSMAVHVKMTGKLVYSSPSLIPSKHTHVIFDLDDGNVLYYNDIRQFGWMSVLKTEDVLQLPFFKSLGREPLKDLDLAAFQKILKAAKAQIKSLLMDQQKIAGIGNIYANDALFMAGIHPTRVSLSLTIDEAGRLFGAIEEVLQKSIAVGGASANNYVNALGERGTYQEHFLVYQKEGKPCPYCSSGIVRVKTSGRSTFFCPKCQI